MTSHARTVTPTHDPLPTQAPPAICVQNIVKKYGECGARCRRPTSRKSELAGNSTP